MQHFKIGEFNVVILDDKSLIIETDTKDSCIGMSKEEKNSLALVLNNAHRLPETKMIKK